MTKQITKILIANRGEIACRVIKTAQKMGIATVAVHSDADRKALHVRQADEAVHIGPSPAIESYLVIEKIIAAAKETGADAVHPGYGFLSENPDFVRACEKANLVFIGPSAEAMEAMGLKDAAKKLMDDAGVPITPGYHGKDQSPKLLRAKADKIGYPVLIKAVAGGGGKGMRKVETDANFDTALASCKREAASSFGNDDVLIEKYIQSPRHIEVQVFGDSHGNIVHMFERDCSLQRRHQKVIEEAPAPGMTKNVRKAMTDAAIKAAKAVDYVGAGTVEFIVDGSKNLRTDGFWFMEMNTRLQVEHPVTEMITGLDLVEWQIRVAQGEALLKQKDITLNGHAIEARLYAEDPANDFLPSVGPLDIMCLPVTKRVDTGVEQGGEVSQFYDPMIAKLISHADTRDSAINELARGCRNSLIYPIRTNARFLYNCLMQADFTSGNISTGFIDTHADQLQNNSIQNDQSAISNAFIDKYAMDGWRLNQLSRTSFYRFIEGEEVELSLNAPKTSQSVHHRDKAEGRVVFVDALYYLTTDASGLLNTLGGGDFLTAPMPGKIIALSADIGDIVTKDDSLVVMEAMKMEQTLVAPRDGVVAEIGAVVGELVTEGALLIRLKEEEKK